MSAQDVLRRNAIRYHLQEDRSSSCGNMALDMDLIFNGYVRIGKDVRLYVTDEGLAFLEHNRVSPEKIRADRKARGEQT